MLFVKSFFLRPLSIIAWKLAWCLPGIKLFMSSCNLGLSVYVCFCIGDKQEQTKDEMFKSGWFYTVYLCWKGICVYIGPEVTNKLFNLNSQQSTWREKALKEQLSHLSTLLPTLCVFWKYSLAQKFKFCHQLLSYCPQSDNLRS